MDTDALVQGYMKKYNNLMEEKNTKNIEGVVNELNEAIRNTDMERANEAYTKILGWNFKVANLEGERESLNKHIRGKKLPSVDMFAIAYDDNDKMWKFNV